MGQDTEGSRSWALTNCRAVTPGGVLDDATVAVREGTIAGVGQGRDLTGQGGAPPADAVLDLGGLTVLPGLIDLHIHGAGGADAHAGEIADLAAFLPRCGVTAFLPTLAADAEERTLAALRAVAEVRSRQAAGDGGGGDDQLGRGALVLGAHLEGPFLNPERAGAIPSEYMRLADAAAVDRLLGVAPRLVRLMTLAPEVAGALELIPRLIREGVVVSIGHTAAGYELARRALDAGARHTTHLFNAMTGLHHRALGPAGAMLTDERATVELIADGEHVHPAMLALAIRAKGSAGVALVSDAVGPAGLPPGEYDWLGKRVRSDGRTVRLPDGTLAGSLGTLDVALRTVTGRLPDGAGFGMAEAALMAATVPARILGLERKGRLVAGCDADLTALDSAGRVRLTIVGGRVVYDAR
jgi:N-acetylglucosamine-6-phosphate deacetylase